MEPISTLANKTRGISHYLMQNKCNTLSFKHFQRFSSLAILFFAPILKR
ncbi:hypothetical protein IFVP182_C2120075 [Vibrio parahaemolyticus]